MLGSATQIAFIELFVDLSDFVDLFSLPGELHVQPIACGQLGVQLIISIRSFSETKMGRNLSISSVKADLGFGTGV